MEWNLKSQFRRNPQTKHARAFNLVPQQIPLPLVIHYLTGLTQISGELQNKGRYMLVVLSIIMLSQ